MGHCEIQPTEETAWGLQFDGLFSLAVPLADIYRFLARRTSTEY